MTMEQEKNLRIVQSIINVVMCVDPSHDVQEAVCDLMIIAREKLRAVFEEDEEDNENPPLYKNMDMMYTG